jgi:cell wall-associated NlpC family hydrolase
MTDLTFPELDALPTGSFEITPTSVGDDSRHAPAYKDLPDLAAMASVAPAAPTLVQRAELRRVILRAAYVGVRDHNRMSYTEGPLRWSGIADAERDVADHVPPYSDCSSFATWCYWDASRWLKLPDIVNGANWLAGYTGTMVGHGTAVAVAQALPGDLIFYGSLSLPFHVAVYAGGGRVVSMGRPGAPELVPVGAATQCRRYI